MKVQLLDIAISVPWTGARAVTSRCISLVCPVLLSYDALPRRHGKKKNMLYNSVWVKIEKKHTIYSTVSMNTQS